MSDTEGRFRCPECHDPDHLWEEVMVSGWRGLDTHLKPTHERDTDWYEVEQMGNVGCSACEWRGSRGSLQKIGIDGEPLPFIHPHQMEISA